MAGIRPLTMSAISAVIAAWAYFGMPHAPIVVALAVLGIVAQFPHHIWRLLKSPRLSLFASGSPAGTFIVPRAILAFAGYLVAQSSTLEVLWLIGFYFVLGAELTIRALADRVVPVARNLPGYRLRDSLVLDPAWAYLISSLALLLWPLRDSFPWLHAGTTVMLAVAGLLTVFLIADASRLILRRRATSTQLQAALNAYEPRFLLHWQAPKGTSYQVSMWLPYLEQTGHPYFILLRSPENFDEIARLTNRPILLRESLSTLDDVMVPSLHAALYVNTATVNNHMVRYREVTHIQLNHGDSDKAPSYNPSFRAFDRNFVAGQAAIDRFAANGISTTSDFFEIVGRPQVASVQLPVSPISAVSQPTVLYAPTWQGFYQDTDYSSLEFAEAIVQTLLFEGYRVIFRPHPYSRKNQKHRPLIERVNAILAADPRDHVYGRAATEAEIFDLFNESDLLIADLSSVVSDYLASTKPIVLVRRETSEDVSRTLGSACYELDVASGTLDKTAFAGLLSTIRADDPLSGRRTDVSAYYLSDVPAEGHAQLFVDTLDKYLS
ncbi:CDP-glycerol glycerophosphotransferase family protein [Populibacterium corticicola]|uniref:CDP-glycerol glycerophosphotransferase family protein n=1 Tax=Populibacterium corticicola TaxID=1812826 RepID=A0ABW5XDB3_9MICO